MRNAFSLLVKPASSACNLRCKYCFYLDSSPYGEVHTARMSDAVLERVIQSYLETEQDTHIFIWQGGEPTLMGVDFFRKIIELQRKYAKNNAVIANALQTNATLLTTEMCRLLHTFHFLVGCSLDGPALLHDTYRLSARGAPTHKDVIRGINELQKNSVDFNIMTLVSQANVRHAREVYRYFKEMGYCYHQYIPCVEYDENGKLHPYAINGEDWGDFLCQLFDEWYRADINTVSVRLFDTIVSKIVDGEDISCTIGRNCCQYFVVEHNGDIYPCDFHVTEKHLLGNIMNNSWMDFVTSGQYIKFGSRKTAWSPQCENCSFIEICAGDCVKHRLSLAGAPYMQSVLCQGWKKFFNHSSSRFRDIAQMVRDSRA